MMTDKIKVVNTRQKDIDLLKGHLSECTIYECWEMAHLCADCALQLSFDKAFFSQTIYFYNQPILCFGLNINPSVTKVAHPWLLPTNNFKDVLLFTVKYIKDNIRVKLNDFDLFENYIPAGFNKTKRFLSLIGFQFDDPVKYPVNNIYCSRFWMKRELIWA